jgi:large subunit ribosomal protein L9
MRVILKERVASLGKTGDIVQVSSGFGRNFLLPRGLALVADKRQVAFFEHQKRLIDKKRLEERASMEEMCAKLKDVKIDFSRKVHDEGKLFGSVSVSDIVEALHAKGFKVERKEIMLEQPIRSLGVTPVEIRCDATLSAFVSVCVTEEKA